MTSYLGECSRGVVLVNELQDPDQGSPNDDWMTKDGVSCVPGLERDTSFKTFISYITIPTSSSTSGLNLGSL